METRRREDEPLCARIVGECAVRLWELSSEERLRRQLRAIGIEDVRTGSSIETEERPAPCTVGHVLLLRADRLYDPRILRDLAGRPGVLVVQSESGVERAVAANVPARLASACERALRGEPEQRPPGIELVRTVELSQAYAAELLKVDPPAVLRIRPERRAELERRLFEGSYKGVTDLVTKFFWPGPARLATRFCARLGISPNLVTWLSVALVLAATWEFFAGRFASGLALAWIMTFLDTVDGKLARVTVQSSTFGHYLDHGLDVLHPPFWYLAWGLGLGSSLTPLSAEVVAIAGWVIVAGYVAGRLLEAAFNYWLAGFSMFCWRPVDSYFRLVLARRNPNLILLTVALGVGRPDAGFLAVAAWTAISSGFLLVRLATAFWERRTGELRSWLDDPALLLSRSPFAPRPVDEPV